MVGLSIVLEGQHKTTTSAAAVTVSGKKTPQVISKTNMSMLVNNNANTSSSSPSSPLPSPSSSSFRPAFSTPDFLDQCFLCKTKLLPGKDIYMYRGDRAFCSEECRCRQILLDEAEALKKENICSFSAIRVKPSAPPSSSSPRNRRGNRNGASGGGGI